MPAENQDVTHWKGDSAQITIGPVTDSDGGFPDLTDASAKWYMAASASSTGSNVFVTKSTDDGGIIITGDINAGFVLTIELLPNDTEDLVPGAFYHECEVTDAAGEISTVTVGAFTLKQTLVPNP